MNLRSALNQGRQAVGTWLFTPNSSYVELAGHIGVHFVLVDLEHGEVGYHDLPALLRAAAGRTAILVRPASHDPKVISKLADFGADGVVVPKVDTVSQAEAIAAACRYPPRGNRGLAPGAVRASGYGTNAGYRDMADEGFLVAVQIETKQAFADHGAFAKVKEIDMLFVGPGDLTADLGYPRQCAESAAEIDALLAGLQDSGKLVGTVPYFGADRHALLQRGVSLVVAGSDVAAHRNYLEGLKLGR
jgi:4-hydroxy-2-oxoheptanedioate aldolase